VTRDRGGDWRIRERSGSITDEGEVFVVCNAVDSPRVVYRPGKEQLAVTCREGLLFYSLEKDWDIGHLAVFPGGGWRIYGRSGYYTGDTDGLRRLCDTWDDPEYVPDAKINFKEVAEWMGFSDQRREHPGVAVESVWRKGVTTLCAHKLDGVPTRRQLVEEITELTAEVGGEFRISDNGRVAYRLDKEHKRTDQFWLGDIDEPDDGDEVVFLNCRRREHGSLSEGRIKCIRTDFKLQMSCVVQVPAGKEKRMRQLLEWLLIRRPEYGPQRRAPW